MENQFYTFRGYMNKDNKRLTASMEDYLEMIYRISLDDGFTRIHDLALALNVQPPSATKMVKKLAKLELVNNEKHGIIILETKGKLIGENLLKRHIIVENFLKILGIKKGLLKQTETIEHTLSNETLKNLNAFIEFLKENKKIIYEFEKFKRKKLDNP